MYKQSLYNVWEKEADAYICFNTYSKALVRFESREYLKLMEALHNREVNLADPFYKDIAEQGIIIDSEIDEINLLKFEYNINYYSLDRLQITWLPTYNCNFNCPYCFEKDYADKTNMVLGREQMSALMKYSDNHFKKKQSVHISLFGGEPLLEYNKIKTWFDYILKNRNDSFKFSCSVTTNGYLLNKQMIDELVDIYMLTDIQITVEGSRKTHDEVRALRNGSGTFDRLMKNFKLLINKSKDCGKFVPKLRINLSNHNLHDLDEVLDQFTCEERAYFSILLRPVHKTTSYREDNRNFDKINLETFFAHAIKRGFNLVYNLNKTLYCEGDGALNSFHILPDLSVWKCVNNINRDTGYIGRISEEGKLLINLTKIEKYTRNSPFDDPECRKCQYLPLCYGGCPIVYCQEGRRTCFYEKGFSIQNIIRLQAE